MTGATTMGYRTQQCSHWERKTNEKCNNHAWAAQHNSAHTENIHQALPSGYPAQQRDNRDNATVKISCIPLPHWPVKANWTDRGLACCCISRTNLSRSSARSFWGNGLAADAGGVETTTIDKEVRLWAPAPVSTECVLVYSNASLRHVPRSCTAHAHTHEAPPCHYNLSHTLSSM